MGVSVEKCYDYPMFPIDKSVHLISRKIAAIVNTAITNFNVFIWFSFKHTSMVFCSN